METTSTIKMFLYSWFLIRPSVIEGGGGTGCDFKDGRKEEVTWRWRRRFEYDDNDIRTVRPSDDGLAITLLTS